MPTRGPRNQDGFRRPLIEIVIKGRSNSGRTALAVKIQKLLASLDLEVEVVDQDLKPRDLELFARQAEDLEIVQRVDPKIIIRNENILIAGRDDQTGLVPLPPPESPQ